MGRLAGRAQVRRRGAAPRADASGGEKRASIGGSAQAVYPGVLGKDVRSTTRASRKTRPHGARVSRTLGLYRRPAPGERKGEGKAAGGGRASIGA